MYKLVFPWLAGYCDVISEESFEGKMKANSLNVSFYQTDMEITSFFRKMQNVVTPHIKVTIETLKSDMNNNKSSSSTSILIQKLNSIKLYLNSLLLFFFYFVANVFTEFFIASFVFILFLNYFF